MRNILFFLSAIMMMLTTSVSAQNEYIVSRVGGTNTRAVRFGPINGWTVLSTQTKKKEQAFLYGPNGYIREVSNFEVIRNESDVTSIQALGPDGTLYLSRSQFSPEIVDTTFYRLPVDATELQAFHSLKEKNRYWSQPAVSPKGQIGIIRPLTQPKSPRYEVELISNGISTITPVQFRARKRSNYGIFSEISFSDDERFYVRRYTPVSHRDQKDNSGSLAYEDCFVNVIGVVECHRKPISIIENGERLTRELPGIYRGKHSYSLINESTGETLLYRSFGNKTLDRTQLVSDGTSFVAGLGGYSQGKFGPEILTIHRVSGNDEKYACDSLLKGGRWYVNAFSVLNSEGVLMFEKISLNDVGVQEVLQLIPRGAKSALPGTTLGVCRVVP